MFPTSRRISAAQTRRRYILSCIPSSELRSDYKTRLFSPIWTPLGTRHIRTRARPNPGKSTSKISDPEKQQHKASYEQLLQNDPKEFFKAFKPLADLRAPRLRQMGIPVETSEDRRAQIKSRIKEKLLRKMPKGSAASSERIDNLAASLADEKIATEVLQPQIPSSARKSELKTETTERLRKLIIRLFERTELYTAAQFSYRSRRTTPAALRSFRQSITELGLTVAQQEKEQKFFWSTLRHTAENEKHLGHFLPIGFLDQCLELAVAQPPEKDYRTFCILAAWRAREAFADGPLQLSHEVEVIDALVRIGKRRSAYRRWEMATAPQFGGAAVPRWWKELGARILLSRNRMQEAEKLLEGGGKIECGAGGAGGAVCGVAYIAPDILTLIIEKYTKMNQPTEAWRWYTRFRHQWLSLGYATEINREVTTMEEFSSALEAQRGPQYVQVKQIIRAFLSRGHIKFGLRILRDFTETAPPIEYKNDQSLFGFVQHLDAYSQVLILGYQAESGNSEADAELAEFTQQVKRGIKLDTTKTYERELYTLWSKVLGYFGKSTESVNLLTTVAQQGGNPTTGHVHTVLKTLLTRKHPETAFKLLNGMEAARKARLSRLSRGDSAPADPKSEEFAALPPPRPAHYALFIQYAARRRSPDGIIMILRRIKAARLLPDHFVFAALLRYARRTENFGLLVRMYEFVVNELSPFVESATSAVFYREFFLGVAKMMRSGRDRHFPLVCGVNFVEELTELSELARVNCGAGGVNCGAASIGGLAGGSAGSPGSPDSLITTNGNTLNTSAPNCGAAYPFSNSILTPADNSRPRIFRDAPAGREFLAIDVWHATRQMLQDPAVVPTAGLCGAALRALTNAEMYAEALVALQYMGGVQNVLFGLGGRNAAELVAVLATVARGGSGRDETVAEMLGWLREEYRSVGGDAGIGNEAEAEAEAEAEEAQLLPWQPLARVLRKAFETKMEREVARKVAQGGVDVDGELWRSEFNESLRKAQKELNLESVDFLLM